MSSPALHGWLTSGSVQGTSRFPNRPEAYLEKNTAPGKAVSYAQIGRKFHFLIFYLLKVHSKEGF
jgi:hypothetical protein